MGWRCPEGPVIQYRFPTYCTLPSITSSPTEFDLGWPTPLVKSVYSDHRSCMVVSVTKITGSKAKHKINL